MTADVGISGLYSERVRTCLDAREGIESWIKVNLLIPYKLFLMERKRLTQRFMFELDVAVQT